MPVTTTEPWEATKHARLSRLPITISIEEPATIIGLDLMTIINNIEAAINAADPMQGREIWHQVSAYERELAAGHMAVSDALFVRLHADGVSMDVSVLGLDGLTWVATDMDAGGLQRRVDR